MCYLPGGRLQLYMIFYVTVSSINFHDSQGNNVANISCKCLTKLVKIWSTFALFSKRSPLCVHMVYEVKCRKHSAFLCWSSFQIDSCHVWLRIKQYWFEYTPCKCVYPTAVCNILAVRFNIRTNTYSYASEGAVRARQQTLFNTVSSSSTIQYHSNDPGSLSKHLGKSKGGSFNWYSYLEGH